MIEGREMKKLADELRRRDVHRDTFLGVILQTQSEENAVRMREWLIAHPKESQRRMIQKAMRINNGEGPQPLITIEE